MPGTFSFVFPGATEYAANTVTLRQANQVTVGEIRSAQDCIEAAGNSETVAHLEEVVADWCKRIAQVIF